LSEREEEMQAEIKAASAELRGFENKKRKVENNQEVWSSVSSTPVG
jgi:hypothetical protein